MNRREFLVGTQASFNAQEGDNHGQPSRRQATSKGDGDRTLGATTTLAPYTGPWEIQQAAHLLRRLSFGAPLRLVKFTHSIGLGAAIDHLLQPGLHHAPPGSYTIPGQHFTPWVDLDYDSSVDGQRVQFLQSWWVNLMINTGLFTNDDFRSEEKMALFWHNHFATGAEVVKDARMMYRQNVLLRSNAFGNFKHMVQEITLDPAMLRYLNGNTNFKSAPNENYARELQELFTIGKGPEIESGNYTNYTEDDVKAAARVLTGWVDDADTIGHSFIEAEHDAGDKEFSSAYGNRLIRGRTGEDGAREELNELIDMIFDQEETARYICRKLYRFFVNHDLNDTIEANIIGPMADILRNPPAPYEAFDMIPVMRALFGSEHFFDPELAGCSIKSPAEYFIGMCRNLEVNLPSISSSGNFYATDFIRTLMRLTGMDVCNPPTVFGWPAYYQNPLFTKMWLSEGTLTRRIQFALEIIRPEGVKVEPFNERMTMMSTLTLAESLTEDPGNPELMTQAVIDFLFSVPLSNQQFADLKEHLVGAGNGDYVWTEVWDNYSQDPLNQETRRIAEEKLRKMLDFGFRLPEFQLG